jgi:hypothetical protein
MMKNTTKKMKSRFEANLEHSFRRMWIIALCVAIVAVVPVILFEDQAHWILLVAMIAGGLLGIFVEIREDLQNRYRTKLLIVAFEQQKLEADWRFAVPYADAADSREKQYREAKINGLGSMKRQPAFAS